MEWICMVGFSALFFFSNQGERIIMINAQSFLRPPLRKSLKPKYLNLHLSIRHEIKSSPSSPSMFFPLTRDPQMHVPI